MPSRDGHASGHWVNGPRGRISGAVLLVAALSRILEAESDRLSLWIPVLFAGGILIYFGLGDEPRLLTAAALLMAATGIYLAARGTGLGLVVGGAAKRSGRRRSRSRPMASTSGGPPGSIA